MRNLELEKAVLAVMLGDQVDEAKKPLHPNQQKIDVHEPEKDELTAKDFEMLRAGKKAKLKEAIDNLTDEELDEMDKSMAYATGTKKAMQMTGDMPPLEKKTINKAHDIAKAMLKKEEVEQEEQFTDYDELIEVKPFEYEIQESYNFGDYLQTAKKLVGEEQAIELANNAFKAKDTDLFLEAVGREDIEAKVKMHSSAGHKVSMPKYSTKGGEFHAEYVVTDKESGIRRKYIHHGSSRKIENMGAAGKRD